MKVLGENGLKSLIIALVSNIFTKVNAELDLKMDKTTVTAGTADPASTGTAGSIYIQYSE